MTGSHSPTSTPTSSIPSATTTPGAYSKHLSSTVMLFLWRAAFCPVVLQQRVAFQLSFFFNKYVATLALELWN
jgi:hypothetical protein